MIEIFKTIGIGLLTILGIVLSLIWLFLNPKAFSKGVGRKEIFGKINAIDLSSIKRKVVEREGIRRDIKRKEIISEEIRKKIISKLIIKILFVIAALILFLSFIPDYN